MTHTDFVGLGLAEPLASALTRAGLTTPTPIQARAIPSLLDDHDLIGVAQTGTGKTLAFVAPIVQHLAEMEERLPPRGVGALILAPTRELALQIAETVAMLAKPARLSFGVVFGGVGHGPQIKALSRGLDILVATPGRLLDLMNTRHVRLDTVTHLVLDEADRMLDMGFARDVMKIVRALPRERQSILLSATMPASVAALADEILWEPVRVEVTPKVVTVEKIEQRIIHVPTARKRAVLLDLLRDPDMTRVVVFARTKRGADRLAEQLEAGGVEADAIHGNKSQNARVRALEGFRAGTVRVLVATDIAARGIDVPEISHVVNYDLPNEPESYVHRIGRTARAGRAGIAVSLCDPSERPYLAAIERLTKVRLAPMAAGEGEIAPAEAAPPAPRKWESRRRPGRRRAA